MRQLTLAVLASMGLIGCGKPTPELNGYWKCISFEGSNGERDDLQAAALRWSIADEKVTFRFADARRVSGVILFDEKQVPKTFEARLYDHEGSFDFLGIFERKGDELKVCFVAREKDSEEKKSKPVERPKEFRSKPAYLATFKLQKPEPNDE